MRPKRSAVCIDNKPAGRVRKSALRSRFLINKRGTEKAKVIESGSEPELEEGKSDNEGGDSQPLAALAGSQGLGDMDGGFDASLPSIDIKEELEVAQEYKTSAKYTRSIYVDAFNLALGTVLENESHLFSEDEAEVFTKYRDLNYEAQHLYVRLFLRKTSAWFREHKLNYSNDITDIPAACRMLQSPAIGLAESQDVIATLEEAATLLSLPELQSLAREAKCSGSNKAQLVAALKKVSSGQVGLAAGGQLRLSFDGKGNYINRDRHFVRKILKTTGPCIRLSSFSATLFERVHFVFYRSTDWSEKSLTTVILARTSRRNYPNYIVSRCSNVFPNRQSLLDFEESIQLQSAVDGLLSAPLATSKEDLESVKAIFDTIYPKWTSLMQQESEKIHAEEEALERVYLRRFSAAWVLTRIVHKGAHVLGRLKEYPREHTILTRLLSQRAFHPARRGSWYQRRALIEEHYMHATTATSSPGSAAAAKLNKRNWLRRALQTCEAGLQDPETHLIYHYDLQKRIEKLEQKLRVAKREQHDFGHTRLVKPSSRQIEGERIQAEGAAVGRKTRWNDPQREGKECSVEQMCLSTYRLEGWKGFHCEGGIIRTLFAYLFYDILFLYLPNVFQTPYQTSPLDLFTDGFYLARASEINHRLASLTNGSAPQIIEYIDSQHRERRTAVVGLDWSFEKRDLLEIVECIGGEALAVICKVLCQEYRQRGSGLPDLFLWNPIKKECMFSEVKSENDRLSDTQRLWNHILSGAGVRVELCAAVAKK